MTFLAFAFHPDVIPSVKIYRLMECSVSFLLFTISGVIFTVVVTHSTFPPSQRLMSRAVVSNLTSIVALSRCDSAADYFQAEH